VRRAKKGARKSSGRPPPSPAVLQYKVAELSTVDEGSLEHTVNLWVGQGWRLESVQFAMRESSKRPAMAFVFFTRAGQLAAHDGVEQGRSEVLAGDAWARLAALAAEGDEP
jgi:hypothetical protein